MFRDVHKKFPRKSAEPGGAASIVAEDGDEESADEVDEAKDYKVRLLDILRALPPSGFERICQRLLRESGFQQVVVTGSSDDGGIDGHGVLDLDHGQLHERCPEGGNAGRCAAHRAGRWREARRNVLARKPSPTFAKRRRVYARKAVI